MANTPNKIFRLYVAQLVCSFLGLLTSIYLLVQHTRLKSGIQDDASFCSIGGPFNCEVVAASTYSEIFGIPLATLGAIFFMVYFVMGLYAPPRKPYFAKVQYFFGWITLFALGFDLYLLLIQILKLKAICIFCTLTYVLNGVHLYLNGLMAGGKGIFAFKAALKKRGEKVPFNTSDWALTKTAIIGWTAAIILLPSFIWRYSQFYSYVNNAVEQVYADWKNMPEKELNISETDPQMGNPNAKVKIVEFSDFECPHCERAAFTFQALLPSLKDKVHFAFKHYPLDPSCNNKMMYQLHRHSCNLARLSYCANQKNKFWEFHDTLFFDVKNKEKMSWEDYKAKLKPILSEEEITTCLNNPKALEQVQQHLTQGSSVELKGTPAIFINGKRVTIPVTVDTLRKIIEIELKD